MFKRYLAALLVVTHVLTFSAPATMAADGWSITDSNGNGVSADAIQGGQAYNVANGNIGADQTVNLNILNEQGIADPNAKAIFNFSGGTSVWEGILNLVGTAAFINTAGFNIAQSFQGNINGGALLSSLSVNPSQFFAGVAELSRGLNQDPASIINNGTWNSPNGFVAFISSAVKNNGTINAENGAAVLAAGDKVALDISGGAGLINVSVEKPVSSPVYDAQGNKISDAISNTGTISANGGVAFLTASAVEELFDNVINHSGIVEANSISEQNGFIRLDGGDKGIVAVTGTLNAKGDDLGETGGRVEVLGEKVGLFDGATVDASGYAGGGEVYVGGDYQGLGDLRRATAVYFSKWADINVDATLEGNGGKVILWSDESTKAYGTISARGGILSGDGGLIETSSKGYLDVEGLGVDASAQSSTGNAGTWLIDPYDIEITASTTTNNTGSPAFTPNGNNSKVSASQIQTQLNNGTAVTIATGGVGTGTQNGDITVSAAITRNSDNGTAATLTLNAFRDIAINAAISATAGVINVVLSAGRNLTISNGITTNGGSLTATATTGTILLNNAASIIATAGGFASFTAGNLFNMSHNSSSISTANGNVDITATSDVTLEAVSSGNGHIFVTSNDGSITANDALNTTSATGDIQFTADTGVTLNGTSADVTTTGGDFVVNANADNTGVGTFTQDSGSAIATGGGLVSVIARVVSLNSTTNSGAGTVTFESTDGNLSVGNTITTNNAKVTLKSTNGDILLNDTNADITTSGGAFEAVATTGNFNQSNTGSVVTTAGGQVDVTGSAVTLKGNFSTGSGNQNYTASAGTVDVNNALTSSGGNITLNATNNVNLDTGSSDVTTNGGKFTVNADSDNSGAGTFIKTATGSNIATSNGDVSLSGANIDLNGVVNSGTGKIDITGKTTTAKISNQLITNGGNITVTAKTDVNLDNASSDISTNGGSFTVNADSDANGSGTFSMTNSGSSVSTVSGNVSITANDFNTSGGTINSGTATTFLKNSTAGKVYRVGGSTEAGTFNLSDAELDRITANVLEIGSSTAGNIKLESLQPANASTVVLRTGASIIEQTAGAGNEVTVANLGLVAGGSVDIDIDADKVAAQTTGSLKLDDSDNLTVDTVAGINGITTTNANVTLGATTLALANDVNAGNADVSLTATSGVINQTAGAITANDVSFSSTGAVTLNQVANSFDSVTGTAGGDINIKDSGKTTVEVKALTAVGKNITYFHDGGLTDNVNVTGNITSGSGAVNGGNIDLKSSGLMTVDGDVSSLIGSGGVVTITGAVINGTISNGLGNITLTALGALDTIINTPQVSATNFIINALRDIIIQSSITTTGGANVELNADSDNNGVGGLWLQSTGSINSDGNVTLTGSSIFDAGSAGESIRIDNGATITANGDIDLLKATGAPATSDIVINGNVTSNGSGATITVNSADDLTTSNDGAANLTADNIDLTAGNNINAEFDAGNLNLATTNGNITAEDMNGGVTLTGYSNSGTGTLNLIANSPLTIAADIIQMASILLTASGDNANAGDNLTVANGITVQSQNGDVTLEAGDDIILDTNSTVQSDTGFVTLTSDTEGGASTDSDRGSISLAGLVSAVTDLTMSAFEDIVQSNGSISTSNLILNADNVNLSQAANDVTGSVTATTGGDLSIVDATALDLDASTIGGNLTVSANGNVTDSGALSVTGTTNVQAVGDVTLDFATNDFNTVETQAVNVTLVDADDLDLGASIVAGALNVTTGGNLTDSAAVAVTGTTTLNTGAFDITLNNLNDFSTVNVTNANNVTLADINSLTLGSASVAGAFSATADSDNNTAASTLTAASIDADSVMLSGGTDGDDNINLNGNVTASAGGVTVSNAATVQLGSNVNVAATGGPISIVTAITQILLGATATNMFTTNSDDSITLGAVNGTGAHMTVSSGADVTLGNTALTTGDLTVNIDTDSDNAGALGTFSSINAGTVAIDGGDGDDNVTLNGTVTSNTNAVTIDDVNTLDVNANVTGQSGLTITDTTQVDLADNVQLASVNGAVNANSGVTGILLSGANGTTNTLVGNGVNAAAITATNNVNLNVNSTQDVTLASANINSGSLGVTVDSNNDGANSGTFGALTAADMTFNAGANDALTFNGAATTNTGALTVNNSGSVTFNDTVATTTNLNLTSAGTVDFAGAGASTVGGALNITSGSINDSGAGSLAVTGTSTLATGAGDITLDNTANDFSTVVVTNANNVTLNDTNAINLGNITAAGFLTVTAGGLIDFVGNAASTIAGAMNLTTTAGGITDSGTGSVAVTGLTTLNSGATDITLNNANDFSTVSVTAADDVTLNDTNALDLGASTIGGALGVTANGAITDSGALNVTGATTLAAGAANNITLDDTNNFSSVGITSGNDVTLNDTDALVLNASTISGNLNVTTNGNVTQTGAIIANGAAKTATFTTGAVNDLTLNNASNDFTTVVVTDSDDVNVSDANAIDLGASLAANMTVVANGAITDSGNLGIGSDLFLTAGSANDITLDNANNIFAVTINSADDVVLNDSGSLLFGASTVSGNMNVTTTGNITQSGAIVANGAGKTATFNAGAANDVDLNLVANDFTTVAVTSADFANITDGNAVDLGTSTVNNLNVNATGGVTDSGNLTVAGTTVVNTTASDAVLDNANDFNDVRILSANNVTLNDVNAINFGPGASTIAGDLKVTAGTSITDSGNISANGLEFQAGTTVTLDQAGNDFNNIAGSSNGNITITDADDVTVTTVGAKTGLNSGGASGDITLNTGNTITLTQNVVANGGTGTLTLNTAAGGVNQTGGMIDANELLMLGTGTYTLTQNNDVDRLAANVTGAVNFKDGVNSVVVDTIGATNGVTTNNNNVTIEALNNITLNQAVNAGSGDATLTAGGFIREGVADDATPVADVIAKNIYLNSNVGPTPADAIGESTSYFDIQVTDSATGSFNLGVPNGGDVFLNCIGDCPIGQVNVGTGTFNFSLSGALLDGNDDVFGEGDPTTAADGDWNITAGGINIKTGTGFGTLTDAIELRLSQFGGDANAAGRMAVDGGTGGVFASNLNSVLTGGNTAGLQIGDIAGSFVSGVVAANGTKILSGSPLTIAADVIVAAGDIFLAALGNAVTDDVNVNANVSLTGGNGSNSIIAGHDVLVNGTSVVSNLGTGEVELLAGEDATDNTQNQDGNATGNVTMSATSSATTAGGNIIIDAANNILVSTANAGAGIATLFARAGSVNGADATNLITAATIDADAVTGIGNTQSLNTAASNITADSTNGNVVINNALATAVNANSLTTGTGLVDFDQSGGGSLTVGTASTTDGAITIQNTGGDLTVGTSVNAGGANNVTLATVTSGEIILTGTTTADGDTANINSAASINGAGLVTAGTANLDAITGIGNTTALNTAASTVTADTTNGNIDINNALATAVDANSLTTGTGTITFDQTGGGALTVTNATTTDGTINVNVDAANLTATNVVAGGTGNVNLNTTTSGDILLDVVTADGNTATVTSAGAINGVDNTNITTANTIDFNAATGIGNTEALNTAASFISADSTNGNIDINNALATAVDATSLTTGTGTINFDQTGGGALTVTNATTGAGNITVTNAGANINAVNVVAGTAAAADGDVNITTTTTGDINAGNVSALADTATLNAAGAIRGVTDDNTADVSAGTINLNAAVGGISGAAGAGALDVAATTALNADTAAGDDSNITIDSIIDLPIGVVNAGAGVVTLFSNGNMTDVNDGGTPDAPAVTNIIGSTIDLVALVGGIGTASNAVDFLASTRINAHTNTGAGGDDSNINLRSTGNAPLGVIHAGAGTATITSEGNMTDADVDQTANVIANVINLNTLGSDIGVAGSLDNYLDIQINDPNAVGAMWNASTQGGNLYINCLGVCPTGLVDLGTGNGFIAVGQMIDGNDDLFGEFNGGLHNFIAGGLEIDSVSGVGTDIDAIEMRLGNFGNVAAHGRFIADGGTGGIFATNDRVLPGTFGLELNSIGGLLNTVTADGDMIIFSGSPLVVNVDVTSGSDITLSALGATIADDLDIDNGITVSSTGAGNIILTAGGAVLLRNNSLVSTTGTGTITAAAGEDYTDFTLDQDGHQNGDVRMSPNAAFRSEDGNILVDARRHSRISEVNADSNGDNTRGDVTVIARSGAITDRNGATVNITAQNTVLRADDGIADATVIPADADDNLETDTVTLDLINSTSGHVNVVEVAAGADLDVIRANQLGAGDLNISTQDGSMTIVGAGATPAGFGVSATSGVTNLIVNDDDNSQDHNLNLNNTVTSTTGRINMRVNSRDLVASAEGDVTATGVLGVGGAEIEAFAVNDITMADGTVWNANAGGNGTVNGGDLGVGIDITAQNGDVRLGSVQTTSTAATSRGDAFDAVTISAGQGVIDGSTIENIIANAGQTTITASEGIGSADALDTQIDRLDAVNNGFNSIRVTETAAGGELNIVRVDNQGPGVNDEIEIETTDGDLTVLSELVGGFAGNGVSGLAGQIFLTANGAGNDDNLVLNNQIQSSTGKINLYSNSNNIETDAEGDVTTTGVLGVGGAEIEAFAVNDITMVDGTVWNANAGGDGSANSGDLGVGIDLDAQNGNIALGSVQTTSTAATSRGDANDAVSINALNGAVSDVSTIENIIANAGETQIGAANGIGHGDSLETQMDRFTADNSTSNDIDVRETAAGGALNIVHVDQNAATGRIDIQTLDGTLTVLTEAVGVGAFTANGVAGLAGEIFLRANGSGGNKDLVLNNQIESSTGKINVDSSSDEVIADEEGDITATGGAEIESDAINNITMADGTIWNANGGDTTSGVVGDLGSGIDLNAQFGNITLGSVQTTSNANHAVVIVANNGAIVDGGDTDVFNITSGAGNGTAGSGGGIILKAKTGIGSTGTGVNIAPDGIANNFHTDALETSGGRFAAFTESGDIQVFNTGSTEITTLTDNDLLTPQGSVGAGTVVGVMINDPAQLDLGSDIFFTAASPFIISSAVVNNDGAIGFNNDITLASLGATAGDTMTINANVTSAGGDGDILITSGGTMTQANGTVVSTSGDGVTAGLGNIIMAAGEDRTGDGNVADSTLVNQDGDVNADLIMGETAAVRTEGGVFGGGGAPTDGTITMNANRDLLIAEVNADSNGDNLRGNVFTNSFNRDTLDSQLDGFGAPTVLNITADVLTMFAAGVIGFPEDPIETNAQIINAFAFGGIAIDNIISTVVDIISVNGNIQFRNNGTIFFGGIHALSGDNNISSTQSMLAVDNGNHITGNNIQLAAGGIIGEAGNPLNLQLNGGNVQLNVGGSSNSTSAFIAGNFSAADVQQLNTAPGLIFLNGVAIGGGNISQFDAAQNQLFAENNRLNNPFVDYPGYGNVDRLAFGPTISINTSAIDTLPVLEALPPTVVPIPGEAETEEQRRQRTAPAAETKQPQTPAVQGQTPPTVVTIPAEATPTLQPDVEQ